ncbi:MAG TPA: type II secretion system F family protein [Euryarchaeota archaeon]|nr:type II secretion system F family protein [Euryarchaeota archaeon]
MAKEVGGMDDIKDFVSEPKKKRTLFNGRKEQIESVDDIINRMREKYEKEGAYVKDDELGDKEIDIKDLLSPTFAVSGSPEDLVEYDSPFVRFIGRVYLAFRNFFDALIQKFADRKFIKSLDWDLYSANLPFTGVQYLALILVLATILSLFSFVVSIPIFLQFGGLLAVLGPVLTAIIVFALVYIFGKSYPRNRAKQRSKAAEKYLPFALRHLAVEIRAGMGLYQAMRAVAEADYGVLSEEFKRTLWEIDEGKSTEMALSNLAARMQSKGVRRAIANILRAVRIGGNLSDAIMTVASDVAFEQRMKVAAYGEKLNFFSVIFMFVAVVFPVMLAMITTIGYAPTGSELLSAFQLPTYMLAAAYLIFFPGFLLLFLYFIKTSDPMR